MIGRADMAEMAFCVAKLGVSASLATAGSALLDFYAHGPLVAGFDGTLAGLGRAALVFAPACVVATQAHSALGFDGNACKTMHSSLRLSGLLIPLGLIASYAMNDVIGTLSNPLAAGLPLGLAGAAMGCALAWKVWSHTSAEEPWARSVLLTLSALAIPILPNVASMLILAFVAKTAFNLLIALAPELIVETIKRL